MAEKYELAALDYVSGMKYKDIAEKYEVSIDTVKSWKKRHWQDLKKGAHIPKKRVHTKKESASKSEESVQLMEFESGDLTEKQWLFCRYYVQCFNATKAYQLAYGCAYNTAMVEGSRHLRNPKLKITIDELKEHRLNDEHFSKYDVLQKYKDIAFADITWYLQFGREEEIQYDDDGFPKLDANGKPVTYMRSFVHLNDSAEVDGTLITEIKEGREGISFKLADKMKALDVLAKYTDLLDEQTKSNLQVEKAKVELIRAEMNKTQSDAEHNLKLEQMQLNIEKSKIDIEAARDDDKDKGPIQIQIIGAKRKE